MSPPWSSVTVNFIGQVGGVTTQELSGVGSSTASWQTEASGFTAPIDTLEIVVASGGTEPLDLDNLVLTQTTTATPEPASLTLLGFGAVGLLGYGWRRRKRAAA